MNQYFRLASEAKALLNAEPAKMRSFLERLAASVDKDLRRDRLARLVDAAAQALQDAPKWTATAASAYSSASSSLRAAWQYAKLDERPMLQHLEARLKDALTAFKTKRRQAQAAKRAEPRDVVARLLRLETEMRDETRSAMERYAAWVDARLLASCNDGRATTPGAQEKIDLWLNNPPPRPPKPDWRAPQPLVLGDPVLVDRVDHVYIRKLRKPYTQILEWIARGLDFISVPPGARRVLPRAAWHATLDRLARDAGDPLARWLAENVRNFLDDIARRQEAKWLPQLLDFGAVIRSILLSPVHRAQVAHVWQFYCLCLRLPATHVYELLNVPSGFERYIKPIPDAPVAAFLTAIFRGLRQQVERELARMTEPLATSKGLLEQLLFGTGGVIHEELDKLRAQRAAGLPCADQVLFLSELARRSELPLARELRRPLRELVAHWTASDPLTAGIRYDITLVFAHNIPAELAKATAMMEFDPALAAVWFRRIAGNAIRRLNRASVALTDEHAALVQRAIDGYAAAAKVAGDVPLDLFEPDAHYPLVDLQFYRELADTERPPHIWRSLVDMALVVEEAPEAYRRWFMSLRQQEALNEAARELEAEL